MRSVILYDSNQFLQRAWINQQTILKGLIKSDGSSSNQQIATRANKKEETEELL